MADKSDEQDEAEAQRRIFQQDITPTLTDREEKTFFPWHKPRKHYIRVNQWCAEVRSLIKANGYQAGDVIRYLGFPGEDFLDIRYAARRLLRRRRSSSDILGSTARLPTLIKISSSVLPGTRCFNSALSTSTPRPADQDRADRKRQLSDLSTDCGLPRLRHHQHRPLQFRRDTSERRAAATVLRGHQEALRHPNRRTYSALASVSRHSRDPRSDRAGGQMEVI